MRYIVEEKSGNTYSAMEMCEPSTYKFLTYEKAKAFYDDNSSDEEMQKKFLDTETHVLPFRHKNRVEYIGFYSEDENDDDSFLCIDSKLWGYEDALAFEQENESC